MPILLYSTQMHVFFVVFSTQSYCAITFIHRKYDKKQNMNAVCTLDGMWHPGAGKSAVGAGVDEVVATRKAEHKRVQK